MKNDFNNLNINIIYYPFVFLEETVPQYDDQLFLDHFRISRRVVGMISEQFSHSEFYNRHAGQYGKLSPLDQVKY